MDDPGTDRQGRLYARVADVAAGSVLEADEHFECVPSHSPLIIESDCGANGPPQSLYFQCTGHGGKHRLHGQLSNDETHYIGLYQVRQ